MAAHGAPVPSSDGMQPTCAQDALNTPAAQHSAPASPQTCTEPRVAPPHSIAASASHAGSPIQEQRRALGFRESELVESVAVPSRPSGHSAGTIRLMKSRLERLRYRSDLHDEVVVCWAVHTAMKTSITSVARCCRSVCRSPRIPDNLQPGHCEPWPHSNSPCMHGVCACHRQARRRALPAR